MTDTSHFFADSRRGTYYFKYRSSTDKFLDLNPKINPHTPARLGSLVLKYMEHRDGMSRYVAREVSKWIEV
jgi:hypothetical protein